LLKLTNNILVPTLRVGMQSGRSASRVSHARRGASPRHSHAERGNEKKVPVVRTPLLTKEGLGVVVRKVN